MLKTRARRLLVASLTLTLGLGCGRKSPDSPGQNTGNGLTGGSPCAASPFLLASGPNNKTTYVSFIVNVHDWLSERKDVFASSSSDRLNTYSSLTTLIDLHEKYALPVDFYFDDQILQKLNDLSDPNHVVYQDLLARIKASKFVAVSYHIRAPNPFYSGYDWFGITSLNYDSQRTTFSLYETRKTNLTTGMYETDASKVGGYALAKSIFGRAPYIVSVGYGDTVTAKAAASVYREQGAQFVLTHSQLIDWGTASNCLAVRPEHCALDVSADCASGEACLLSGALCAGEARKVDASKPLFLNFKIHDDNFVTSGTPWDCVYYLANPDATPGCHDKSGNASRPYTILKPVLNVKTDAQKQAVWDRWEYLLIYFQSHGSLYTVINAKDLAGFLAPP